MIHARQIVVVACLVSCLVGCSGPEEEPLWEKVKIGDLAPRNGGKSPTVGLLKTINLDVHVFEVPAENISKLDEIRRTLFVQPLRLKDYTAFSGNSFLVRFGKTQMWNEILGVLFEAGGQKIASVSLMLPDGQPQTIAITGLNRPQTIFYTPIGGSKEGANIGPGIFGLRVKANKIPGSRGVCNVVAYPVFSPPTASAIPQLDARTKLREFAFTAAAFGLKMSPGDLVFLGPKEYVSDQTTLGGLFFSNPQGSMFFGEAEREPPKRKPAVRVFLLVCTRIDY